MPFWKNNQFYTYTLAASLSLPLFPPKHYSMFAVQIKSQNPSSISKKTCGCGMRYLYGTELRIKWTLKLYQLIYYWLSTQRPLDVCNHISMTNFAIKKENLMQFNLSIIPVSRFCDSVVYT